ncbi:MAG: GYDIA family GHMP kinase [Nonlabens sp.]
MYRFNYVKPLEQIKRFKAHGKFLITGEYAVLDNVPALAVPLKLDQRLIITTTNSGIITWRSFNSDQEVWIDIKTTYEELIVKRAVNLTDPIAKRLSMVLLAAADLNPNFQFPRSFDAITELDFNQYYGMGTSSTLVSLVAQWVSCDPFKLQFKCFGGSGYDVACARISHPIIYIYNNGQPLIKQRFFDPIFEEELFFVYLNQKQNSRESIAKFDRTKLTEEVRKELAAMPDEFIRAGMNRDNFEKLIARHEMIIGDLIGLEPVKNRLFPDYKGAVKSLGGWGGDFVMATGTVQDQFYFRNKGYATIYNWKDIVITGD